MAAPVSAISKFVWGQLLLILSLGLISLCAKSSSGLNRTLKLVHVLFRHGNRSPISAYPSDPYQEESWPQGYGQLTQEGMRQQYELGQWFRKRYVTDAKLLSASYVRSEINVWSTARERTLMSAESNLAGLYPPSGAQKWNKKLAWQPIPVFTRPLHQDKVLAVGHAECPRFRVFNNSKLHLDYINRNKAFFNKVAKFGGFDVNSATFSNFSRMADTLYFERADKRRLPDWATDDVVNRLLQLLDYEYESDAKLPDEYFQPITGSLINEMVNHMKMKVNGTENVNMYMYSAHDTNVFALQRALQVFNNKNPPPASCVMVELYQESDQSYVVEVLLRNDSRELPYTLPMPGTSGRCSLDHFYQLVSPVLVSDVDAACMSRDQDEPRLVWNAGWILVVGGASLAVVVAVTMVIFLLVTLRTRRQLMKSNQMQPINIHLLSHGATDSEDESVFDVS